MCPRAGYSYRSLALNLLGSHWIRLNTSKAMSNIWCTTVYQHNPHNIHSLQLLYYMKKRSTFNPDELPPLVKGITLNCLSHLRKRMHIPHAVCRSNKVHTPILVTHHEKPEKNISPPFPSRSNLPENLLVFLLVPCAEEKGFVLLGISSPTTVHTGLTSCSQREIFFKLRIPWCQGWLVVDSPSPCPTCLAK